MLSSLKPGGEFICEGSHTSQMEMTSGGPKSLDLLWDLDEVMEIIGQGFTIKHAKLETVELDESDCILQEINSMPALWSSNISH
jgi:hypothetical protein